MFCECGCRAETGVYTNSSRGHKQGEPRKFLRGHHISTKKMGNGQYCKRGHERLPENVYGNGTCKLCSRLRDSTVDPKVKLARTLEWGRTETGARSRKTSWLKHTYNLTPEQKQDMLILQNNRCRVCKVEFDDTVKHLVPHIDHNHACCPGNKSCGKCVRGLLCRTCNTMLGICKDNIQTLENAVQYLKETTQKCQNKLNTPFALKEQPIPMGWAKSLAPAFHCSSGDSTA